MTLFWLGRLGAGFVLAASLEAPRPIALPEAPLAAAPVAEAAAAGAVPASPTAPIESGAALAAPVAAAAVSAESARPSAAVSAPESADAGRGLFDGSAPVERPELVPLLMARERSQRVLSRYFPSLYRELGARYALVPAGGVDDTKSWTDEKGHHIDWYQAPGPVQTQEARVDTPFAGPKLAKRVVDLIVHLHEYAHLLFNASVAAPAKRAYDITARETLTEGFALTLELASVDRLIADAEAWKLTKQDIDDLRSWKQQRLGSLRRRNHYSEGLFYFLHPLFKRDGEAGLARFIAGLQPELLGRLMSRGTFLSLIGRNPSVFEPVLTRPPAEQPALKGMAAIIMGGKPTPEQRMAAVMLIEQADDGALRRALRPYLLPPGDTPSELARNPHALLAEAFRLAAFSDRAARTLSDLSVQAASDPDFQEGLAAHPEWAATMFSGIVTLPLDAAQRAAWRRTILRWAPETAVRSEEGRRVVLRATNWLSSLDDR